MFYCTHCKKYINGRVSSNDYSLICEGCGYDTIIHEDTWKANFEKQEQRLGDFMKTFDSPNRQDSSISKMIPNTNRIYEQGPSNGNIIIGTLMIILGILTLIATYKHVLPTGSIILIIAGIFIITIRKRVKMKFV